MSYGPVLVRVLKKYEPNNFGSIKNVKYSFRNSNNQKFDFSIFFVRKMNVVCTLEK